MQSPSTQGLQPAAHDWPGTAPPSDWMASNGAAAAPVPVGRRRSRSIIDVMTDAHILVPPSPSAAMSNGGSATDDNMLRSNTVAMMMQDHDEHNDHQTDTHNPFMMERANSDPCITFMHPGAGSPASLPFPQWVDDGAGETPNRRRRSHDPMERTVAVTTAMKASLTSPPPMVTVHAADPRITTSDPTIDTQSKASLSNHLGPSSCGPSLHIPVSFEDDHVFVGPPSRLRRVTAMLRESLWSTVLSARAWWNTPLRHFPDEEKENGFLAYIFHRSTSFQGVGLICIGIIMGPVQLLILGTRSWSFLPFFIQDITALLSILCGIVALVLYKLDVGQGPQQSERWWTLCILTLMITQLVVEPKTTLFECNTLFQRRVPFALPGYDTDPPYSIPFLQLPSPAEVNATVMCGQWTVGPYACSSLIAVAVGAPRMQWSMTLLLITNILLLFSFRWITNNFVYTVAADGIRMLWYFCLFILAAGREKRKRKRFEIQWSLEQKIIQSRRSRLHVGTLLMNMLPVSVLTRLMRRKNDTEVIFDQKIASVLYSDIAGFTAWSSTRPATTIVAMLNVMYRKFDAMLTPYGVEKITTIGDAYWATCGLTDQKFNHAVRLVGFGLRMHEDVAAVNDQMKVLGEDNFIAVEADQRQQLFEQQQQKNHTVTSGGAAGGSGGTTGSGNVGLHATVNGSSTVLAHTNSNNLLRTISTMNITSGSVLSGGMKTTKRGPTVATPICIRVGVASGDVIGGVVGKRQMVYHVFGPINEEAEHLESKSAIARGVLVSKATFDELSTELSNAAMIARLGKATTAMANESSGIRGNPFSPDSTGGMDEGESSKLQTPYGSLASMNLSAGLHRSSLLVSFSNPSNVGTKDAPLPQPLNVGYEAGPIPETVLVTSVGWIPPALVDPNASVTTAPGSTLMTPTPSGPSSQPPLTTTQPPPTTSAHSEVQAPVDPETPTFRGAARGVRTSITAVNRWRAAMKRNIVAAKAAAPPPESPMESIQSAAKMLLLTSSADMLPTTSSHDLRKMPSQIPSNHESSSAMEAAGNGSTSSDPQLSSGKNAVVDLEDSMSDSTPSMAGSVRVDAPPVDSKETFREVVQQAEAQDLMDIKATLEARKYSAVLMSFADAAMESEYQKKRVLSFSSHAVGGFTAGLMAVWHFSVILILCSESAGPGSSHIPWLPGSRFSAFEATASVSRQQSQWPPNEPAPLFQAPMPPHHSALFIVYLILMLSAVAAMVLSPRISPWVHFVRLQCDYFIQILALTLLLTRPSVLSTDLGYLMFLTSIYFAFHGVPSIPWVALGPLGWCCYALPYFIWRGYVDDTKWTLFMNFSIGLLAVWWMSGYRQESESREQFVDTKMMFIANNVTKKHRQDLESLLSRSVPEFALTELLEWLVSDRLNVIAHSIPHATVMFFRVPAIGERLGAAPNVPLVSVGGEVDLTDDLTNDAVEQSLRQAYEIAGKVVGIYDDALATAIAAVSQSCVRVKTIGDIGLFAAGLHRIEDSEAVMATSITSGAAHPNVIPDYVGQDVLEMIVLAMTLQQRVLDETGEACVAGIHTGSVVSGVLGDDRLMYDVFGDTVNTASRVMSSTKVAEGNGGIWISEFVVDILKAKCLQPKKKEAFPSPFLGGAHSYSADDAIGRLERQLTQITESQNSLVGPGGNFDSSPQKSEGSPVIKTHRMPVPSFVVHCDSLAIEGTHKSFDPVSTRDDDHLRHARTTTFEALPAMSPNGPGFTARLDDVSNKIGNSFARIVKSMGSWRFTITAPWHAETSRSQSISGDPMNVSPGGEMLAGVPDVANLDSAGFDPEDHPDDTSTSLGHTVTYRMRAPMRADLVHPMLAEAERLEQELEQQDAPLPTAPSKAAFAGAVDPSIILTQPSMMPMGEWDTDNALFSAAPTPRAGTAMPRTPRGRAALNAATFQSVMTVFSVIIDRTLQQRNMKGKGTMGVAKVYGVEVDLGVTADDETM